MQKLTIVAAALAAFSFAAVSQAEAQIQLTPDSGRYLIQRTVGAEEWAISYNFEDGTLTGNVFKTDGSPPSFIWCEFDQIDYADDPADNTYTLDCFGSDACTASPCSADAWNDIGQDIPLPASFLLPEGTVATFGGQIEPIFNQTCAIGGCHDSVTAQAGLDLSQNAAYDSIFNVASSQMMMTNLVQPFAAGDSYLYMKLIGEGMLSQMPVGGMLSEEQLGRFAAWINEGAARN